MTHIKLSICIATRNRADYIGETLSSIVGQATDAIEIVVLDGASTDATPGIVAEFQATFPRLRYVRKERNGGVDRDYDAAVVEAQGVYCWLMSDDDLLKPGAIARVLDALDQGHSLVIYNAELSSVAPSERTDPRRLPLQPNPTYTH